MKTKIWSLQTRISHWLLAIGFAVAYITGENEWKMNYHYAFGAMVGGLLFLRILYGFIGPKYSNFKDFPMGISHQMRFIKNYFTQNTYVGHNPLASLVMLAMMFAGVFTAITGYFWATETAQFLGFTLTEEGVEESHEIGAKLFLILVFAHLAGILADTFFHRKTGTLASIFTGYKNVTAEEGKSNTFHRLFSIFWLGIPLFLFYLAFGLPVRAQEKEHENNEEDEWESLLFPEKVGKRSPMKITLNLSGKQKTDGTSAASSNKNTEISTTTNQQEPTANAERYAYQEQNHTNQDISYENKEHHYKFEKHDQHEDHEHEEEEGEDHD